MLKVDKKDIKSQFDDEKSNEKLSKILTYWIKKMGIKEEDIQVDVLPPRDIKSFSVELKNLEDKEGMENSPVARKITKRMLTLPIYKYYLEIYAGKMNEKKELKGIGSLSVLSRNQLGLVYSPGVGYVSKHMFRTKSKEYNDFCRSNRYCYFYSPEKKELTRPGFMYGEQRENKDVNMYTITDGSATLGIGNVAECSIPVMFGKTVLLESFGGKNVRSDVCYVDTRKIWEEDVWKHKRGSEEQKKGWKKIVDACVHAVILIKEKNPDAMIMLEDIAAPVCFDIEEQLNEKGIFTIHDDQWGTAIIFAAGVYNAIKLAKKKPEELKKVVFNGAGASAVAVARTLNTLGVKNIIAFDSRGALHKGRKLTPSKEKLASFNLDNFSGSIEEALVGADGFVGLSQPGLFKGREIEMLGKMNKGSFVFAGANPDPEFDMFTLDKEKQEGGKLTNISFIGCGAFGNPGTILNNSSAFPGLYRALTDAYIEKKLKDTKNVSNAQIAVESAKGLASAVEERDIKKGSIVPRTFTEQSGYNFRVTQAVATKVWVLVTGESEEQAKKKYSNLSSELIEFQKKNMEKYKNITKEAKTFVNGMIDLMGEQDFPVMKELKKHIA